MPNKNKRRERYRKAHAEKVRAEIQKYQDKKIREKEERIQAEKFKHNTTSEARQAVMYRSDREYLAALRTPLKEVLPVDIARMVSEYLNAWYESKYGRVMRGLISSIEEHMIVPAIPQGGGTWATFDTHGMNVKKVIAIAGIEVDTGEKFEKNNLSYWDVSRSYLAHTLTRI